MLSIVRALGGERRSFESSLSDPATWLYDWFSGGASKTRSGMNVTEASALTINTVWACIRVLSEDVAKVPITVVRRLADDHMEPVRDHTVSRLLNVAPNDEMPAMAFRQALTAHKASWGNGYAEIQRTGARQPVALWPMTPDRVTVRRLYAAAGGARSRIVYEYNQPNGGISRLDPADVLHIRGPSFDGLVGYSVIRLARESMALAMAAEAFGAAFFGNGARPSLALKHPKSLTPKALVNLRKSSEDLYSGVDNAGRIAIFEEGMEPVPFSINPDDAQFLQTRQFQVPEICRWFRMQPHKIADLTRSTFSNIEQSSIEYVDDCLGGHYRSWEQEIALKLFGPGEENMGVEHNEDELKRGDRKSRFDAYAVGRQWGWLSANDVLRAEGQNPIKGGDVYWTPVNMAVGPTSQTVFGQTGNAGDGAPDAGAAVGRAVARIEPVVMRFRALLARDLGGSLKIEAERLRKAARRDEVQPWAAEFYSAHSDHVRGAVFPTIEAMMRAIDAVDPSLLTPAIQDLVRVIGERHVARSLQEVKGLPASRAETVAQAWETGRADAQAEDELRRVLVAIAERTLKEKDHAARAA